VSNFAVFLEKRPLMVKILKFCFESSHQLTDRRCYVEMSQIFFPTTNRRNRALFTGPKKIRLPFKVSLLRGSRPKIFQGQPPTFGSQCSRFHPNRLTFGGVVAERVNTVLLPRRVFSIFVFGRIIIRLEVMLHTNIVFIPCKRFTEFGTVFCRYLR